MVTGKIVKMIRMNKRQKGYTLLEYCMGAAILAGVVWVGLDLFGQQLRSLLNALTQWTLERSQDIQTGS